VADTWLRTVSTNDNNDGFFGSVGMIDVNVTQTALRSWWNVGFFYLSTDENVYPPGSSILRAGLLYDVADLEPLETPTPITNSDADWLAITTLNPSSVQLSRATNVAWQINWGFPIDESVKSMRRNDTMDDHRLYIAWEMELEDEISGFTMSGWWASLDTLIRNP
jgi:hypothetical protein